MILNNKRGKKQIEKFVGALSKLNPLELLAISKMLGVSLKQENLDSGEQEMRDGQDITYDIVNAFARLNRYQRRNILAIIQEAG